MTAKYKYLLTYRYAEIIQDLTVRFCEEFLLAKPLGNLSNLSDLSGIPTRRTIEQMISAARSNKQNIVEGVSEIASLKSEIKLLGISQASTEELTVDFEDFLRQRNLPIWDKTDPRVRYFRNLGIEATSTYPPKLLKLLRELKKNRVNAGNFLLTLCHQLSYLLMRQIKARENTFLQKGGYTENLFRKRITWRNRQHK